MQPSCLPPPRVRTSNRGVAKRKRAQLAHFASRASSAAKIQSAWRGKMAQDSYLRVRCSWLASREIQRTYRGHLARRATRRRRDWQSAGPGAERLKLGMRMIEDTKVWGGKNLTATPFATNWLASQKVCILVYTDRVGISPSTVVARYATNHVRVRPAEQLNEEEANAPEVARFLVRISTPRSTLTERMHNYLMTPIHVLLRLRSESSVHVPCATVFSTSRTTFRRLAKPQHV